MKRPRHTLRPEFHASLTDWHGRLSERLRLAAGGTSALTPVADVSAETLLYAAGLLCDSGTPASSITGITSLLTLSACETILRASLHKASGTWSPVSKQLAISLLMAAKSWARLPRDDLHDIATLCLSVVVGKPGMHASRRRNDQFETSDALSRPYSRSRRLFDQADRLLGGGLPDEAAMAHEAALAWGLLATGQVGIDCLLALNIEKHLERDHPGRVIRISMSPREAGNVIGVDVILPPNLAERVERHLKTFRPILLAGGASAALFVGEGGTPLTITGFKTRLRRR